MKRKEPLNLTWHHIDPAKNKRRWYSLSTSRDLWGNQIIVKRWGRMNSNRHSEQIQWPADLAELQRIVQQTRRVRERRGYRNQK